MPDQADTEWDVLISYSHEDSKWVHQHLYRPLLGCRTTDGRAPRVFLDQEAIQPGEQWVVKLAPAVFGSRKIIPVFSKSFFISKMCLWELGQAVFLDPLGERKTTIPVLMDPSDKAAIPDMARSLQYLDCSSADWFDRLIRSLDFQQIGRINTLRFVAPPPERVMVNQTLPEIRVAIECEGNLVEGEDEMVSLLAEQGTLRGTVSVKALRGMVVFTDLFLDSPATATRLVATAARCPATYSKSFAVIAPEPIEARPQTPLIQQQGEAVFFGGGKVIALIDEEAVKVYDLKAQHLGGTELPGRVRIVRRLGGALVIATWNGEIVRVSADGTHINWNTSTEARRAAVSDMGARYRERSTPSFQVPGELAGGGDGPIYAGMWDGTVFRLDPKGSIVTSFVHAAGVQSMAVAGDRIFICDLEGQLAVYEKGVLEWCRPVDRLVRLLKLYSSTAVVVGERTLHQFSLGQREIYSFPLPFPVRAVYADTDRPIAVGMDGKGIFFDEHLTIQSVFAAAPGAVPVSADRNGTYCVLKFPDGSCSLLHRARTILQHTGGSLAVSETGAHFAVGDSSGFRIVPRADLLAMAQSYG